MAYLLRDDVLAETFSARSQAARPATATPSAELTDLEWSVVALASVDRLSTLRTPGRFGIICGYLFGKRHNPELASPHLEALRRLAVVLWHGISPVPHAEVEAFTSAGFTQGQYDLVVTRIALQLRRRPAGGRR